MVRERFPGVTLIESGQNLGFGRTNNLALPRCRGRFVWLLNPDTELLGPTLGPLLDVLRDHPDAAAVGPRLLNADRSFQRAAGGAFPSLARVAAHWLFLDRVLPASWRPAPMFFTEDPAPRGLFETDWVSGAGMLLRRDLLGERIFDEAFFMFGEDMELCHRLRSAGRRVLLAGGVSLLHHHGASMAKQTSAAELEAVIRGPRAFFRMHHGRLASALYDWILLAGCGLRWAGFRALHALRPSRDHARRAAESRRNCAVVLRLIAAG